LDKQVKSGRRRTLFIYWGRRGSLSGFTLKLSEVAPDNVILCLSRQNEFFDQIRATNVRLLPVNTFNGATQAIFYLPRIIGIRERIRDAIRQHSIEQVVVLMSHVWTPLIADAVRKMHVRYVVIVHDANPHPGDPSAVLNRWLFQDALKADEVVTLSRHVADQLVARVPKIETAVKVLFHPVTSRDHKPKSHEMNRPMGFLFLGRIMAYKGLPLFVKACELVRVRGLPIRVGVVGEGDLSECEGRLKALEAEIANRWVSHEEIERIAQRYDAVVMSNVEASQSGIIALAHGIGLPVLTTPVGGLVEQVEDERSGLIAREVSATAVADVMQRFLTDDTLREELDAGVREVRHQRSMERFLSAITSQLS
jgi:glycosyltransferase involved in cell wall biosynthesis